MGPMPALSQNWSAPFSPRTVLCCAMDSSTGSERITRRNYPTNLGFGRGDERRTLYVTARANLFRIKTLMDGFHPFEK